MSKIDETKITELAARCFEADQAYRAMGQLNANLPSNGKRWRKRVFLDELPPNAGRYKSEPDIECGVLCSSGSAPSDRGEP